MRKYDNNRFISAAAAMMATMTALLPGASEARAQFFTDNFSSPSTSTAIVGNSIRGLDHNWAVSDVDNTASAKVGGGQLSFTGTTSTFTRLVMNTGLSPNYNFFNAPVTYTMTGLGFAGTPDNRLAGWAEIHVGPSTTTIERQSSLSGSGSTMFVVRLRADGQLRGGAMENNAQRHIGALSRDNMVFNHTISSLPASGLTLSLTLSGISNGSGDEVAAYTVTVSDSSGKTLYTSSGTAPNLLKSGWDTPTGGAPGQGVVSLLLQESLQSGTPGTFSLTSFTIGAGHPPSAG
jgi:hypothetical protein